MLYEIMKYINDFFATNIVKNGDFTIEDGTISLPFISEGQYFIIEGSNFNDRCVYKYPATDMNDESFSGVITVLAPPAKFLELSKDIEDFEVENTYSNLQSESYGGYSYTRATAKDGGVADWHDVFRQRLNAWRKI